MSFKGHIVLPPEAPFALPEEFADTPVPVLLPKSRWVEATFTALFAAVAALFVSFLAVVTGIA